MTASTPILSIDLGLSTPVYEQLTDGIRAALVAGELKPGDTLPTVRQLALDLGIHHNTVAEAYRRLAREGWLELRRRVGVRVVARPQPAPSVAAEADFARRLREFTAKAAAQGLSKSVIAANLQALAAELVEGESQ